MSVIEVIDAVLGFFVYTFILGPMLIAFIYFIFLGIVGLIDEAILDYKLRKRSVREEQQQNQDN